MNQSDIFEKIDQGWTLFLDRDGVLNRRIVDGYVRNWSEWEWLPGVLPAMRVLAGKFGRIIVVTNQRGIALGLYTEAELQVIHQKMISAVVAVGGRIDGVYHCPHDKDAGCTCRKPGPGMILKAKQDVPEIDLQQALMVGDSISDMQAAKAAKIPGVFIGKMHRDLPDNVLTALPDLARFARLFDPA